MTLPRSHRLAIGAPRTRIKNVVPAKEQKSCCGVVTGRHHIARSAVGPRLTFSPSAPASWGSTARLSGRSFCKQRLAIASSNVRPLQQISKTRLAQAAGDLPHKTSEPVLVFAPSSSSARSQIRPPSTGNNLSLARSSRFSVPDASFRCPTSSPDNR